MDMCRWMLGDVAETLGRFETHLAANGVDRSEYDLGAWANRLIRDDYRPPFVVPEKL